MTEFDEINSCSDTNTTNNTYNCPQCGKDLSSSRSLRRHIKTFHPENNQKNIKTEPQKDEGTTISCKECNVICGNRKEYQTHKLDHKQSFECDVCHKIFRTRFRLKVHYVMHMKVKPFLCEVCSRPFARASTLRRHRYTHATEKKFVCDCGKRFPASYLLKLHQTQSHTDAATVMCAQCSKIFASTGRN